MKHGIVKNALTFLVLALAFGSNSWGQVYTKFGPATGILKGSTATYQTTAAAAADVTTLFGCTTAGQFLNQAGGCTVPAGVAPSGITNLVYATPNGSTGAATLRALVAADQAPINLGSTANGGVLSTSILLGTNGGTSNGFFSVTGPATTLRTFTFPNASATVLTTNALVTVAQGGTGVGTLTGVITGNGTSAFSAATSANVISLWTGTCSSGTFLRGDGTCVSPGSGSPGGANTNIQFNNSGSFGGDAGLTYTGTGGTLTMTGGMTILNSTGSQNFSQLALNSTTSTVASYLTFNNNSVQKGILTNERTAGSNCAGSSVDDFCIRSISGKLYGVDSIGAGHIPTNIGRIVWMLITGTAGGCTVVNQQGLSSTTCTRSGVGAYSVSSPSGFNNNAGCTAAIVRANGYPGAAEVDGSSSTIGVTTFNTATGSAAEAPSGVGIICVSTT